MMPKAYIVANNRPEPGFAPPPAYREAFNKVLVDHGGKEIVRSREFDTRQGQPDYAALIIIEFPSKAAATAAIDQYMREANPILGHLDRDLFVVEGHDQAI